MPEISRTIRDFYERYPYPQREPGKSGDPDLDWILSLTPGPDPMRKVWHILDAGCGTGQSALGAALLYPHYQVTGIDINRTALAQIQEEVTALDIRNLRLLEANLLNLPPDLAPPGGFDIILCTGVIHHTSDPEQALRNLVGMLAPHGVIRLFVYGELGRLGLYRLARALKMLSPGLGLDERLKRGKQVVELIESYSKRHGQVLPVQVGTAGVNTQLNDPEFVDRYLNPHDKPLRVSALRSLTERVGLRLARWYEPQEWDLDHLLPGLDANFSDCWEGYTVVEELFDRHRLDGYFVRAECPLRVPDVGLDTLIGTHPHVTLQMASMRGIAVEILAKVRHRPFRVIQREELRLLRLLANVYGSVREVRELWESEGQSLLPLDEHLELIRAMLAEELLFSPHAIPNQTTKPE